MARWTAAGLACALVAVAGLGSAFAQSALPLADPPAKPAKPAKPKPKPVRATIPAPDPVPAQCVPGKTAIRPGGAMLIYSADVDPKKLLTVAAVGDVLLHDTVQAYAAKHEQGFLPLMRPVADLIGAADVAFANLEGPAAYNVVSNGREVREPKTRYDKAVYSGYPMFNYHPSIARALKQTGFDVILTANNHALDRHALGADRTLDALKQAGLNTTGTKKRDGMDAPWHTVTKVESKAGTHNIAWLGCTYGTNDVPDRFSQVLNCYAHKDKVLAEIAALRARPDIHAVVLAPHWGVEYQHQPEQPQIDLARQAIDAGATAVIGTHPHVIQPFEKYVAKDGREGFIAYSLGNFVSNQIGLPRRSTVMLLLGLAPDAKSGKLAVATVGYVPLAMIRRADPNNAHSVEAIDRSAQKEAAENRAHLMKLLPPGNLHPPTTDFWAGWNCPKQ
ncbi:MAG: CapA family protein [Alphaproteobacteria bacterium]